MNRRAWPWLICVLSNAWVLPLLWAPAARADGRVRVDEGKRILHYAGGEQSIPLAAIDKKAIHVEELTLAGGAQVTHVKIDGAPQAWEALVGGDPQRLLFSGSTGLPRGEDGERTGQGVQIVRGEGATSTVLVGDLREDTAICGLETTLLSPRVLDPKSLTLRGATVQRLPLEQRKSATALPAAPKTDPAEAPLGKLVVATSASSGTARALTDGDASSVWTEQRPGAGQGEFVTMMTPREVPLTRLAIMLPVAGAVAPHSLFVVTEKKTFAVTFPDDASAQKPPTFEVRFPEPVATRCLSIVLDSPASREPAPAVGLAEVAAFSAFDEGPDSADKAARALGETGERAEAAAAVLKRSTSALRAVRAALPALDPAGRARAVDVASAAECADGAPLLTDALGDADREVVRKATGKLERCGKTATEALAAGVRAGAPAVRAQASGLLARISPRDALVPLADGLSTDDAKARAALRAALRHAAASADAKALGELFSRGETTRAKLDVVRALGPNLGRVREAADARLAELLTDRASMETRYLAVEPLTDLAATGDANATARLGAMLARDPDPAVRAHAAEALGNVPGLAAPLAAATQDPEPRVREAALRSVGTARFGGGEAPAIGRLAKDGWTFVRTAAAGALAALPSSAASNAGLTRALSDKSARVRVAAISGLVAHGDKSAEEALAARAFDRDEDNEVRVAAARALGKLCSTQALSGLSKLAASGVSQVANEDERTLAMTAIDALGRIHPKDLASRLSPARAADASDQAKKAVARAMAEKDVCR